MDELVIPEDYKKVVYHGRNYAVVRSNSPGTFANACSGVLQQGWSALGGVATDGTGVMVQAFVTPKVAIATRDETPRPTA